MFTTLKRGTSITARASACAMLVLLSVVVMSPSRAFAAATCTISDNNFGPNAHILTDGENTINVHIQNDGDTNAIGYAFKGDTKIAYTGDNSQGESASYYKPNQTETGSFEMIYRVLFASGGATDYTLHMTPTGNFTNYAPVIYVGSGYNNPVNHATDCVVNLHLQHSATVVTPVPDAPTLTGTAGNAQNVLNWNSVTNATTYQLYQAGTKIYDGGATTFTQSSLSNGTAYSYTVKAVNVSGSSANSNSLTLTPVAPAPTPPPVAEITPEHKTVLALLLTFYVSVKFLGLFVYKEGL